MSKLVTIAILLTGSLSYAQTLEMSVVPQPMFVGEPAQLQLKYHGNQVPILVEKPDVNGLEISLNSPSSSRMSINNVMSVNTVYTVTATHSGKIEIPALKVKVGSKILETDPVKVVAVKRHIVISDGGKTLQKELSDLLYGKIRIYPDKDKVYVGEEISAYIEIYSLQGLRLQLTYPVLDIKNVIVKDCRSMHRDRQDVKDFEPYRQGRVNVDNLIFDVYRCRTSFRPIAAGTLEAKAIVNTNVLFPAKRGRRSSRRRDAFSSFFDDSDDFIFSDPFSPRARYDKVPRRIVMNFPTLDVLPLPQCPDGTNFLGLVGNWDVNIHLSSDKFKAGDHFTMLVNVKGQGTLDTLKVSEVKIPGFNSYPPEVEKSSTADGRTQQAELKFVLIPLEQGPVNLDLTFSVFDTGTGKYQEFPFKKVLKVAKSDNPGGISQVYTPSKSSNSASGYQPSKEAHKISEIFYLKKDIGKKVQLPLWKNGLTWYLVLLVLGPLVLLIREYRYYHNRKLENDPLLVRKRLALTKRGKLLSELKKCQDDEISQVAQKDLVPFLNDILGEAPGTPATELAEKVEDKEIHECLHEVSVTSFMPGTGSMDKATLRKKLIRIVKRLSILFISLAVSSSVHAGVVTITKDIKNPQEAINAYNDGDFKDAAIYYRHQIDPDDPSPNVLYNLGNCLYQIGDLPRALVAYERALRLSPRDSDILENINLTRRKLFLPEIRRAENPLQLLENFRDSFRPDQWMLAITVVWTLIFLIIAGRHRLLRGKRWTYLLIAASLTGVVCLFALVSQNYTTYSPDTAIVVLNNAPVYSLPTIKNGRIIFKFKAGEQVQIEEELNDWVRVRDSQTEGWVRKNDISSLWHNK